MTSGKGGTCFPICLRIFLGPFCAVLGFHLPLFIAAVHPLVPAMVYASRFPPESRQWTEFREQILSPPCVCSQYHTYYNLRGFEQLQKLALTSSFFAPGHVHYHLFLARQSASV